MDIDSEIDELAISKSSEHRVEDEASKSLNRDDGENDLNMINTRPKTYRKIVDSDSEVNGSADDFKKNLNEPENVCAQPQSNLHAVDEEELNKSVDIERENKDVTSKTKTKQSDDMSVEEDTSISLNQDDKENDLNIRNTRPKTYRKIVDSDSEVDESCADDFKKKLNEPENDCAQPQSNLQAIEEEELNKSVDIERENKDVTFKTKPKRIAIIDSDSEDETPHNKSLSEDFNAANENSTSATVDNHNKEELLNPENKIDDTVIQKSRIAALCDSESSEDEREHSVEHERWPESPPKGKPYSKRSKKSGEEPSQKKMSGKEALQQRNEIRSESQRMLRESRLSLPYHKPKSHSIKEFLQNRPRLSLLKTNNTPPSLAMKMSTEQLKIVSEKLEERKKEVEKFYKSESESEEEKEEVEDQQNEESNEPPAVNKEGTAEIISEGLQLEEKETEQLEHNDKAPTFDVSIEDTNLPSAHSESPMEVSESTVNVANEQLLLTSSNELESNQGTCASSTLKDDLPKTPNQMSPENSEAVESKTNALLEGSSNSMEYDFNLDGVEDFSENSVEPKEKNVEEDHLQRLLKKYDAADNPVQPLNDYSKKLSKVELLKQLGSDKPRLSGGPNEEIDLEEGTAKPSAVAKLMERFLQHTAKKTVTRNKIQVDIINLSQGEVRKETVAVSVDPEEEPLVITEKPGVKLQKLRTELQSQMAQRRSELWKQKQQPVSAGETKDACDDEKSDCGADEDLLDDEEEAELTDGETTDEEEEEDDCYVEKPEKARVQSAFIENEAEESDAEESGSEQSDETSENKEPGNENPMESNINGQTGIKKPLRRILKGFTEDSDDEDKESDLDQMLPKATDARSISAASTDTWEDDEDLPPNQPRLDKTPHRQRTPSKPDLGFLTPVIHLTGLQGLNSGSKFLRESSVSPFSLPPDPSPLKEKNWNTTLQKKLFADSCDALDSEANMEEIAQMCSGKFAETQPKPDSVDAVTTQDLLSICSGSFSGISVDTESNNLVKDLPSATDESDVEFRSIAEKRSSQMISLNLDAVEIKDLDDDRLISELLDEEEMEQFKKKFESPGALGVNTTSNFDEVAGEVKGGGILFDSSDAESELTEITKKNVKKLHKKLTFSDDESNSELEEEDNDEEISLCDDLSDEDDAPVSKVVEYDSEENEVEIDNEEGIPQKNLNPSDFFENEAELSESDWDSADEDEKGLDALEFEQGDAEVFDENKIRNDLEKIHMRQVLDQDNQEIKILQELLLEDGELHGTGRQRQFRWKNIDDAGNDENAQGNADLETYLDEEESEEQWRRARHEREMFLKNKQEKQTFLEIDDLILDDSNSQVIKMGQEAVRKSLSAAAAPADKPKKANAASPEIKKPLILMNTRGSFLARNDKFLTRLAEFTKSTTSVVIGGAKKSKNFVFQTVTEDADESVNESSSFNKKRKAVDGTPTFIKKLRLNSDVSPAINNSKRKKQLFE